MCIRGTCVLLLYRKSFIVISFHIFKTRFFFIFLCCSFIFRFKESVSVISTLNLPKKKKKQIYSSNLLRFLFSGMGGVSETFE